MSAIPYYSDNLVTLYHGDCIDLLPEITGVDAVITSPPYNLARTTGGGQGQSSWRAFRNGNGVGYDAHQDAMDPERYTEWQRLVLAACWATLSDRGAIFYNHKPRVQAKVVTLPTEYGDFLPLRQVVIWDRGGGMNFSPTHYLPMHEWICVWAKPAWGLKSRGASGLGDVWTIRPERGSEHPAPFPLEIPERIIETAAPSLVLDPFAGSGTTLLAARNAGVSAIGIELSERYCEDTARRLSEPVAA